LAMRVGCSRDGLSPRPIIRLFPSRHRRQAQSTLSGQRRQRQRVFQPRAPPGVVSPTQLRKPLTRQATPGRLRQRVFQPRVLPGVVSPTQLRTPLTRLATPTIAQPKLSAAPKPLTKPPGSAMAQHKLSTTQRPHTQPPGPAFRQSDRPRAWSQRRWSMHRGWQRGGF